VIATTSLKTRAAGFLAFLTINLMAYGNPSQPTLTIINGSHSKTVTGVADIASFSGVVGNWEVSLAGGSVLAGPLGPILNLSSTEYSLAGIANPGALTITLQDSGFTSPPTISLQYSDTSINFAGSTNVKLESLFGAPQANTAISPDYSYSGSGAGPSLNGNLESPLAGGATHPFGLELEAVITPQPHGGGQDVLTSQALSAADGLAPEPGLYGILAVGLGSFFFVVKRRRGQARA